MRVVLLHCMSPLLAQSAHELVRCTCPLLGVKRTCLFALQMPAYDAVDGARSEASKCHRVVCKANHIEGSRPWARLARSVLILRSRSFRCMGSMTLARWCSESASVGQRS